MSTIYDQQQPVQRWVAIFAGVFGFISIGVSAAAIIMAPDVKHGDYHGNGYASIGAILGLFVVSIAAFVPAVVGLCLAGGAAFIGATQNSNKFRWPMTAIWINVLAIIVAVVVLLLIFRM